MTRLAKDQDRGALFGLSISSGSRHQLEQSILNRCLVVACKDRTPVAGIGFDLDTATITSVVGDNSALSRHESRQLIGSVERRAVQFGIFELHVSDSGSFAARLEDAGYCRHRDTTMSGLHRAFPRRATRHSRQIFSRLRDLGIPSGYPVTHRISIQPEAQRLLSIGADVFDREQLMAPAASRAWRKMVFAADADGVCLQAVSAFRSIDYQAGIVERKLKAGQTIEQILEVSAAPGFSEHHTGRAIDVTTPGFPVLEEEFENSDAYRWLEENAARFGFRLSFPIKNRHRVAYEPWHWFWSGLSWLPHKK